MGYGGREMIETWIEKDIENSYELYNNSCYNGDFMAFWKKGWLDVVDSKNETFDLGVQMVGLVGT